MACFLPFTVLPLRPLFSLPFFISRISVLTFLPVEGEYLRVDFFAAAERFFAADFRVEEDFFVAVELFFAVDFRVEEDFFAAEVFLCAADFFVEDDFL